MVTLSRVKGFIFLTALLTLLVVSSLAVTAYELVRRGFKLNAQQSLVQASDYHARWQLQQTEAQIIAADNVSCKLDYQGAQDWADDSTWLHLNSCQFNNEIYHDQYVLEHLQTLPCMQFAAVKGVEIWRLHLSSERIDNGLRVLLQSVLALPAEEALDCEGPYSMLKAGRQAWHRVL